MTHDKTHIIATTGAYFRGDAEQVLRKQKLLESIKKKRFFEPQTDINYGSNNGL